MAVTKLDLNNKIINGAMDFWQRNTSSGLLSTNNVNTYTADRWFFNKTSTSNWQVTRSTDVPSSAMGQYSLYIENQTASASVSAGDYAILEQRIEGNVLRTFKDKKMVLKFWVKSSKIGAYYVSLRNNANNRVLVSKYTVSVANTWEQKTIRVTHDSTGSWLYDSGVGIKVAFSLVSGSTFFASQVDTWNSGLALAYSDQVNFADVIGNDFYLTDVCFVEDNEGRTRTPDFTYAGRDVFEELSLCQRYYNKSYELNTAPATATSVNEYVFWCPTAVSTRCYFNYPVPMRTFPILSFWSRNSVLGQWLDTASAARSVDASNALTHGFSMDVTPGAVNRYVLGHYSADAEL